MPPGSAAVCKRGDVDSIAEKVLPLNHHVAEIDADREAHPTQRGQLVVACAQRGLDIRGAADGFDGAGKLRQNRVARRVEHATVVRDDQGFEDFLVASKRAQSLLFVLVHQAAEFGDIRLEDRGELAFDWLRT
jgi:hypothetical protein